MRKVSLKLLETSQLKNICVVFISILVLLFPTLQPVQQRPGWSTDSKKTRFCNSEERQHAGFAQNRWADTDASSKFSSQHIRTQTAAAFSMGGGGYVFHFSFFFFFLRIPNTKTHPGEKWYALTVLWINFFPSVATVFFSLLENKPNNPSRGLTLWNELQSSADRRIYLHLFQVPYWSK